MGMISYITYTSFNIFEKFYCYGSFPISYGLLKRQSTPIGVAHKAGADEALIPFHHVISLRHSLTSCVFIPSI